MESHVSVFFVLLATRQLLVAFDRPTDRQFVLLGLWLALAMLGRLDNMFMIPLSMLYVFLSAARTTGWSTAIRRCAAMALPIALLIGPYLLFNKLTYGATGPISGAIKSSFPRVTANLASLGTLQKAVCVVALLGAALAFHPALRRLRPMMLVLSGQTLFQGAYVFLFTNHSGSDMAWYAAVGCLNVALFTDGVWLVARERLARAGDRALQVGQRAVVVLSILIVVIAGTRGWLKAWGLNLNPTNIQMIARITTPQGNRWQEEAAAWMSANLPPDSKLVVVDFPGFLAYQTDFPILPLDGLMNDYRYNDELAKIGIAEYLRKHDIRYCVVPMLADGEESRNSWMSAIGLPDRVRIDVLVPLTRQPAGSFEALRQNVAYDVQKASGVATGHGPIAVCKLSAP